MLEFFRFLVNCSKRSCNCVQICQVLLVISSVQKEALFPCEEIKSNNSKNLSELFPRREMVVSCP